MEEYKIKLPSPTLRNFNAVHPVFTRCINFILPDFISPLQNSNKVATVGVTIVTGEMQLRLATDHGQ